MAKKPLSSGQKWFLRWVFLGFGGYFLLQSGRRFSFWWLEVPFPIEISRFARFYVKRTNRNILETALLIIEGNKRKHFEIQSTPQNLGKLTSETTFGHSKVDFRPLLHTKRTFPQNLAMSEFWISFVIPDTVPIPKSLTEVLVDLIFLNTPSRAMWVWGKSVIQRFTRGAVFVLSHLPPFLIGSCWCQCGLKSGKCQASNLLFSEPVKERTRWPKQVLTQFQKWSL